jgi:hypothetical protein
MLMHISVADTICVVICQTWEELEREAKASDKAKRTEYEDEEANARKKQRTGGGGGGRR